MPAGPAGTGSRSGWGLRLIFAKMAGYDHPMCKLLLAPPASALNSSKGGPYATADRRAHGVGDWLHRGPVGLWRKGARLMLAGALLVLAAAHSSVEAGWFAKVMGAVEETGTGAAKLGSGALEHAALYVRSLPAKPGSAVLAAEATQEGHWRFVNRAGETLTAGTPQELARAATILLPEAKAAVRLSLYVTEDTVFERRAALKDLPQGAELFVVACDESYLIQGAAGGMFAEIRPGLIVELRERSVFEETVWQLTRALEANVRVLALEPGGPPRLPSTPRIDLSTRRAMVDVIDPASLPAALGAVRGQTVLVAGRVDGRLLYVQPASGAERSILLPDLFKAAEEADVNLMVVRTASTPRQPGGRNWLWQKVEVKGLEQAMQHPRLADFLNALVAPKGPMTVSATPSGRRTAIEIKPAGEFAGSLPAPVGGLFSGLVSDVTGRLIATGLTARVRSAERQQELDQRLIPGIPSDFQVGYLLLSLLGLLGVPISRAWWRRLWPPEAASQYAGRTGYWAACAVRGGAFLLLFLPLTALGAAPLNLWRQGWEAVTAPARLWRGLTGRKTASAAS